MTISSTVWQIALIAAIVVGAVGLPAYAIAIEDSNRSMGRRGWWLCTGVYIGFGATIVFFDRLASESLSWISVALSLIFFLMLPWFMAQRFLWRVRDAGWDTNLAYLYIFPGINLIPWVLLLFLPSAGATQEKLYFS